MISLKVWLASSSANKGRVVNTRMHSPQEPMTEAAESGERAARAALDDAMGLNVLMRVLDTLVQRRLDRLPRDPWRQMAKFFKAQPRELWRQGVAEHILGASRRAHDEVRRCSQVGYAC